MAFRLWCGRLNAKLEKPYALLNDYHKAINEVMVMQRSGAEDDIFGITITTWVKEWQLTNSYYARVRGWGDVLSGMWYYKRRISVIDGLVALQVTVHGGACYGCRRRVELVKHLTADQNVQCFWTRDPNDGSLHVTVGPLPPGMSPFEHLNSLFCVPSSTRGLFVVPVADLEKVRQSEDDNKAPKQTSSDYKRPKQSQRKKQRAKARRAKRRHTVH
jgi:hypothetical protein